MIESVIITLSKTSEVQIPMSKLLKQLLVISFFIFISASSLTANTQTGGWQHKFTAPDFKFNQSALRYEIPEGNTYKITPRLNDSFVSTHYQVPASASNLQQWEVSATVLDSDSPGAGVGLWSGESGYVFYIFPGGDGFLRYIEGKKAYWTADIRTKNFSYPARITIVREPNGNILAKINDMTVAVRLYDLDFTSGENDRSEKITSVSFATHSARRTAGIAAVYESLEVRAWGERLSSSSAKRK